MVWIEIRAGKTYVGKDGGIRHVVQYNNKTRRVQYQKRGIVRDPDQLFSCSEKVFKMWAKIIETNGRQVMKEADDA